MVTPGQSREVWEVGLIGVLALIWLAALAFFWSTETGQESNLHTLAGIILSYLVLWGLVFFLSNTSKREIVHRFTLTSVSLALFVGFLELLVLAKMIDFRLVFGTPIYEPWRNPHNVLDPKLLHIHKPYYRLVWDGIDYSYDRYGLRNEFDLESADIVVIGDSIVEGWKVSAADLLTSHLAKQLDSTVANLGQSWYGPQQELELLKRHGLSLRPKVCVWIFYEGNDFTDVHRYNKAAEDWETFSKSFHSFGQRSYTKNAVLAVRRLLDSSNQHSVNEATGWENHSGVFKLSSGKLIRIYFIYPGHHLSEADQEALEQVRVILYQAYELCREAGVRFMVVFAPNKFRVYGNFTERDAHTQARYWVINNLPKRLEMIVREELSTGAFLDLTPFLVEEAKRGSLVYFPGWDTHWSSEGHRVAAIAIAEALRQWGENGVPGPPRSTRPEHRVQQNASRHPPW